MLINYFSIVLAGSLAGVILILLFKKLSLKYNLLISQKGIPLIGGIGIWLSFVAACLLGFYFYQPLPKEIIGLIIASFIMLAFGMIDDWKELSISSKLLTQFIAASFLILFGIKTSIIYLNNIFNIIITFIWIIGITNAFNHLDVTDGLAGSVTVIISLTFFILSIITSDIKIAVLSLSLLSANLVFLFFNFPPAKIYLGNSGSHLSGFIVSVIALLISYAPADKNIALLSPLIILGLPIFDTVFIVLIRINKKKFPFKKSNDHLALRLLSITNSKVNTLMIMVSICLFFSLNGIIITQLSNLMGIVVILIITFISLILFNKMKQVVIDG